MKTFPAILACAAALAAVSNVSAGPLDFLFRKPAIEVITVTDMTDEGRLRPAVTPEAPVYYIAVSMGFKDLGGAMGGEKIPPKDEMLRIITKTLASQGYLPATNNTPDPTIALVLAWGTLNTDMDYGFNPDMPPRQLNRQQILKFIGGYKMGFSDQDFDPLIPSIAGTSFMNYESRDFYDLAAEDFYVALIGAYDLESIQRKEKKLLWNTRISCPSRRYWLDEVMPTMLALAAPNIGRETARPVWVNVTDKYKPSVKIGDLNLLEYLETGKLPVLEQADDKKAPKPPPKSPKRK